MPRKNPVPENEKAICRRLREFRESTKLSQVAFANELGLDSGQLRNYEHSRAPIRYRLFRIIFDQFHINPVWLAEGIGPLHVSIEMLSIASELEARIHSGMLFSEAYSKVLEPAFGMFRKKAMAGKLPGIKLSFRAPIGCPEEDQIPLYLAHRVLEVGKKLPRDLQISLAQKMSVLLEAIQARHEAEKKKS